jgi:hypothetical protein
VVGVDLVRAVTAAVDHLERRLVGNQPLAELASVHAVRHDDVGNDGIKFQ